MAITGMSAAFDESAWNATHFESSTSYSLSHVRKGRNPQQQHASVRVKRQTIPKFKGSQLGALSESDCETNSRNDFDESSTDYVSKDSTNTPSDSSSQPMLSSVANTNFTVEMLRKKVSGEGAEHGFVEHSIPEASEKVSKGKHTEYIHGEQADL